MTQLSVPADDFARYVRQLEAAGALPGGAAPQRVPARPAELWATRDECAERHRVHARGIEVAVVSNIGWDLRPVFR